jgi:hypothetical protein
MPLRPPAGFIRPGFDPLKNPNAPTAVSASGGDASASVSFAPPTNVGGSAISAYYAVSNPGQVTATGASSPINVTGLTNGTAYTFSVWALNTYGPGPFSAASGSVTPQSNIGLFAGVSGNNVIYYINIASTGSAADFGDLTTTSENSISGACGSSTRGVWGGGTGVSSIGTNTMCFATFATTGNASDFGDLVYASYGLAGCGSATRGIFGGGRSNVGNLNNINFITIATTGNATDFGDIAETDNYKVSSCSSTTRGIFAAGTNNGQTNFNAWIDLFTIASAGNTSNFGNLTVGRLGATSCSSATRGLFAGGLASGEVAQNVIDFITIASTGNATDFGDLIATKQYAAACSSSTRGVFAGGSGSATVNFVTIATTGNASNFGNLPATMSQAAGCSNAHGGL